MTLCRDLKSNEREWGLNGINKGSSKKRVVYVL